MHVFVYKLEYMEYIGGCVRSPNIQLFFRSIVILGLRPDYVFPKHRDCFWADLPLFIDTLWLTGLLRGGELGSLALEDPLDFSFTSRWPRAPDQLCRDGHLPKEPTRKEVQARASFFCILLSPEHTPQPIFTLAYGVFMLRTLCTQPFLKSSLFHGCLLAPKSTVDSWLFAHLASSWKQKRHHNI